MNLIIMAQVLLWIYLILFIVLLSHELIHLLFVKLFKKELLAFKINPFGGKLTYKNDNRYGEILVISLAPNIILPLVGWLIFYANLGIYGNVATLFCLIHVLNILPITADGRAALYCFLKLLERKTSSL